MQGIERKPEPRFLAGIEHQCMIGFICRASPIVANVSTASRFLLLETARGADYRYYPFGVLLSVGVSRRF